MISQRNLQVSFVLLFAGAAAMVAACSDNNDGSPSPTPGDGGTAGAGGGGASGAIGGGGIGGDGLGGGGDTSPGCLELCSNLDMCGDFPVAGCEALCEETIALFDEDTALCKAAVDNAMGCMQSASCSTFAAAALPGGDCDELVQGQLDVCLGPGYFPGWDACASHCEHAIDQCNVDVPSLSTYVSFTDCFYECKLNRNIDYDAGCINEAVQLLACENQLSCDELEAYLNDQTGAGAACATQAAAYGNSCAF